MSANAAAPRAPHRCRVAAVLLAAIVLGGLALANLQVVSTQGVDFGVTARRLPLYVKAFEFVDRDAQYRQLATEITRGAGSTQARALAVFDWTARRIRPTPDGWSVVDDHILNIIIRGHGVSDQRADVFATLSTYAGVPAFWQRIRAPGTRDGVILTFVNIDGRWAVMDVANGFVFRNDRGELATPEDLASRRAPLPAAAQSLMVQSTPYPVILGGLRMPPVPAPLRAELQMLWPRLWYETKRAAGFERDHANDGFER